VVKLDVRWKERLAVEASSSNGLGTSPESDRYGQDYRLFIRILIKPSREVNVPYLGCLILHFDIPP